MRTDLASSIDIVQHIAPATYSATQTPTNGVDLTGFEQATVVLDVGAVTNDAFAVEVQESDDDGDTDAYTAVADGDLGAAEPGTLTANTVTTIGYYGRARFIRVVATDAGTGDATFGVQVVKSGARKQPVS